MHEATRGIAYTPTFAIYKRGRKAGSAWGGEGSWEGERGKLGGGRGKLPAGLPRRPVRPASG